MADPHPRDSAYPNVGHTSRQDPRGNRPACQDRLRDSQDVLGIRGTFSVKKCSSRTIFARRKFPLIRPILASSSRLRSTLITRATYFPLSSRSLSKAVLSAALHIAHIAVHIPFGGSIGSRLSRNRTNSSAGEKMPQIRRGSGIPAVYGAAQKLVARYRDGDVHARPARLYMHRDVHARARVPRDGDDVYADKVA